MKKTFKKITGALIMCASLLLLSSCASRPTADFKIAYDTSETMNYAVTSEIAYDYDSPKNASVGDISGTSSVHLEASDRKIIYKSWANMQTTEYDSTIDRLHALCDKYGAYFESSESFGGSIYGDGERSSAYTVRIPIENYSAFLGEIGSVGTIISSGEENLDVTEEYVDIEARLESAKIREERVLVLLENSGSLDDVLALERELADIRYEIESMTGSLRKYDSLISYATFCLTVNEVIKYEKPTVAPRTFADEISQSFSDGIDDFVEFWQDVAILATYNIIGICTFVIAVTAIAVTVTARRRKHRRAKAVTAQKEKADEVKKDEK